MASLDLTDILSYQVWIDTLPVTKAIFKSNYLLQEAILEIELRDKSKTDLYIIVNFYPGNDSVVFIDGIFNDLVMAKEFVKDSEDTIVHDIPNPESKHKYFIIKKSLRPSTEITFQVFSDHEIIYESNLINGQFVEIINREDRDTNRLIAKNSIIYLVEWPSIEPRKYTIFLDENKAILLSQQLKNIYGRHIYGQQKVRELNINDKEI